MSGTIPVPRYSVGEKVFLFRVIATTSQYQCPDCLGTGEWPLTTPGGGQVTIACCRCAYSRSTYLRNLSLEYQEWEPSVRELTVGSVRIDTSDTESPVSYMCVETGVGSGSVYSESELESTHAEALKLARFDAARRNVESGATPERLEQARFSQVTLRDAHIQKAESTVWNAHCLVSHIKEAINPDRDDDNFVPDESLREEIRRILSENKV